MFNRLNPELAERFIRRIATYTEYNVNIMDATGHIIASSRNPERVGSFHEIAWHMIQEHQEMMLIDTASEYLGVKNGVNLLLSSGKEALGVVGVTGDPQKVQEIALIIKMALETMIAYEEQQYVTLYQKSKNEQFYMALFEEKNGSSEKLEILADQLNVDSKCIRIPILLLLPDSEKPEDAVSILQQNFLSNQDLCWLQNNHHILIYKKLTGEPTEIFSTWRQTIQEWLDTLLSRVFCTRIFVGTLQCRLNYYQNGLAHCQWLEKNVAVRETILYFSDYQEDYLDSLLPVMELHALYNVYDRYLDDEFKASFSSIIGSLRETNYNLVASSQQLFVHKNTLAFRMNKIKNAFHVNPFQSNPDRQFLDGFYRYLKQKPS